MPNVRIIVVKMIPVKVVIIVTINILDLSSTKITITILLLFDCSQGCGSSQSMVLIVLGFNHPLF